MILMKMSARLLQLEHAAIANEVTEFVRMQVTAVANGVGAAPQLSIVNLLLLPLLVMQKEHQPLLPTLLMLASVLAAMLETNSVPINHFVAATGATVVRVSSTALQQGFWTRIAVKKMMELVVVEEWVMVYARMAFAVQDLASAARASYIVQDKTVWNVLMHQSTRRNKLSRALLFLLT